MTQSTVQIAIGERWGNVQLTFRGERSGKGGWGAWGIAVKVWGHLVWALKGARTWPFDSGARSRRRELPEKRHGREKQEQFGWARTKELGVQGAWLAVFQLHRSPFLPCYSLQRCEEVG